MFYSPITHALQFQLRRLVLKTPRRTLIILVCILIGIVAGFSAFLLKNILIYVHYFIQFVINQKYSNILLALLPTGGLFLTLIYLRIFHREGLPFGISPILESIKNRLSYIDAKQMYGHVFSSAFTVGFGGSAGFEAPIVATGSAIGSNLARYFKLTNDDRNVLLASGAAAGISAIFNAPIAGVLFAIEVLLAEATVAAFIPLLLASASAAIVSRILFHGQLFVLISSEWELKAIPAYILLGALAGLYSVIIIRQSLSIKKRFEKIANKWLRATLGGIILAILIFLFPSLFGEGYFSIQAIFNQQNVAIINPQLFQPNVVLTLIAIVILLYLKILATSVTISAGGNGGIFAPSLFMGGFLGYWLANIFNYSGLLTLNAVNLTVAGMAGVLSGVIKTPLTAVFLIAEITGGYSLFVPLMIVSACAYFIASYFEHKSIYAKELEMRL
ncbi:MAG: chloride channel protein [Bacteroidales bacterium]